MSCWFTLKLFYIIRYTLPPTFLTQGNVWFATFGQSLFMSEGKSHVCNLQDLLKAEEGDEIKFLWHMWKLWASLSQHFPLSFCCGWWTKKEKGDFTSQKVLFQISTFKYERTILQNTLVYSINWEAGTYVACSSSFEHLKLEPTLWLVGLVSKS